MKNYILYLFILLLNICFVVSQQTLQEQCNKFKQFLTDNNKPLNEKNDNCCNIPDYVRCEEPNKITTVFLISTEGVMDYKNYPDLPELKSLQLASFNTYPAKLFQSTIEKLFLIDTEYSTEVNKEVANLQNLKYLEIRVCKFKDFPYHLQSLKQLEILKLRSNSIEGVITDEIKNFNSLKKLDIRKNPINGLLAIPPNLESLEIYETKINTIDVNILKNLKYLGISNNPLADSDNLFNDINNNLTKLTALNLTNTGITVIPKSISNLTNLKDLELGENSISVLPDELSSLPLEIINIENNKISIKGSFNFDHHVENCKIQHSAVCFQKENQCTNIDIESPKICTEEDLNEIKQLQDNSLKDFKTTKEESFFEKNKILIIGMIIVLVLIISFIIYFFFNRKKDKDLRFLVKDENNATYAFNDNEKSREYVSKLKLNNSEDKRLNTSVSNGVVNKPNNNVSNIYPPENLYISNMNEDNGSSNFLTEEQLSPQVSGNENNSTLRQQLNNQLSPQPSNLSVPTTTNVNTQITSSTIANVSTQLTSPTIANVITSPTIANVNTQVTSPTIANVNTQVTSPTIANVNTQVTSPIIANVSTQVTSPTIANVSTSNLSQQLSPQFIDNASTSNFILPFNYQFGQVSPYFDEEEIKLQAKIKKEMLYEEERLFNKKINEEDKNKNNDNDDQLPPYSQ
ncbi:hypothetical protein H8356DRAFT_1044415 [Neocallimastix lanati (nom. inval.)]|nr:hypothetical protein H8356DRAFT_1044415 [Neocallimastix sp. JGI-2020a]